MVKTSPRTKKTTFQVELPEANAVALVGDFNGWNGDATPMKKNKSGVWKTDLKLEAGSYQFRYLVDSSSWLNDVETAATPNDFGTENSIYSVEFAAPKKTTTRRKTTKNGSAGK